MQTVTVAHVITKLELGGAQQNTLDSCRMLDKSRFRAVLFSGPDGHLDSDAARIDQLDFRIVADLVRPVAPRQDRRAFRTLRDHFIALGKEGPLIVHTHSSKAGIVGRLAAKRAGAAHVVHTIHGFGHPAFSNPLARRLAVAAERRAARWTDQFVVVSRANLEEGERLGLFRNAPAELIRSGFDVDAFVNPGIDRDTARRAIGLAHHRGPIVGTVACLKAQKSPLDFVKSAAIVHRQRDDVHFVIAGDGALRDEVVQLARALGVDRALTLLGWRDDIPVVLRALDLFWLTSRWEGLPRGVVQAMAAGVPVIATAADGTRDVVIDGETGVLVTPGDCDRIATRTLQLLADASAAARLAEGAARLVPQFDVEVMGSQLEVLYDRLLARCTKPTET